MLCANPAMLIFGEVGCREDGYTFSLGYVGVFGLGSAGGWVPTRHSYRATIKMSTPILLFVLGTSCKFMIIPHLGLTSWFLLCFLWLRFIHILDFSSSPPLRHQWIVCYSIYRYADTRLFRQAVESQQISGAAVVVLNPLADKCWAFLHVHCGHVEDAWRFVKCPWMYILTFFTSSWLPLFRPLFGRAAFQHFLIL